MRICSQTANLYSTASLGAENSSQGLYGERVSVLEQYKQFSKVSLENDGYSGYIENSHLLETSQTNTHRIVHRSTPLFTAPDIKSPIREMLLLGSELALAECHHEQYLQAAENEFIWKAHAQPLQQTLNGNLVDTAQKFFLQSPYIWGGRSTLGLDCSALVQLCAMLHGWQLPRDTKDQVPFFQDANNTTALNIDYSNIQVNDLLYWPGHVAIACNDTTVTHATAHSLSCCIEDLSAVEKRAGKPASVWRLQHRP